jgi:hypothetical protein
MSSHEGLETSQEALVVELQALRQEVTALKAYIEEELKVIKEKVFRSRVRQRSPQLATLTEADLMRLKDLSFWEVLRDVKPGSVAFTYAFQKMVGTGVYGNSHSKHLVDLIAKHNEASAEPSTAETLAEVFKFKARPDKLQKIIEAWPNTIVSLAPPKSKNVQPETIEKPEIKAPSIEKSIEPQPIQSYEEFKEVALEVYDRLNREYNMDDLVPIYQIRREVGDRVSRTQFNEWLLEMQGDDFVNLVGGDMPDLKPDIAEDSIKTELGNARYYVQRSN